MSDEIPFVQKVSAVIPMSRELLAELDVPGKFHRDDPAMIDRWAMFPVFTDRDFVYRPWRFALRNPLPDLVLFPRAERTITRLRDLRSEVRRRRHNVIDALRGASFEEQW